MTIFGNFFPKEILYRIWDGLILDGNEILIRAILSTWKILEDEIVETSSADQFYQLMTRLCSLGWKFVLTGNFFLFINSQVVTAFCKLLKIIYLASPKIILNYFSG